MRDILAPGKLCDLARVTAECRGGLRARIEDGVNWGLETTPEVLIATQVAPGIPDEATARQLAARVHCPVRRHSRSQEEPLDGV